MSLTPAPRRGFSLVELLMVIVVLGIVLAALLKVVVGQQRFYRGASEMVETQDNVRDAVDLLQGELRGISPASTDVSANGDIVSMTSTSIQFWKPIASAVVCVMGATRTTIIVPPLQLTANTGLTAWGETPKQNDAVLIYDPGASKSMGDDVWEVHTLTAAPTPAATCPITTGFTTVSDAVATGYVLTLNTALGSTIPSKGSAVRVLRQVKYSLYQASDGRWYLGYQECPSNSCNTIQPVSGPYLSGTGTPSGLTFTYYDNTGTVTSTPANVARIDVTTRAATRSTVRIPGLAEAPHVDSLTVSVAVRN